MSGLLDGLLPRAEALRDGATLLRGCAASVDLLDDLASVLEAAPFRHMVTPGGFTMSVAMTNCGQVGWVSSKHGYRYSPVDPESGRPWPAMPDRFRALATRAAAAAGFADFAPDACLINRYVPGARLTLHRDREERDFSQPVVSVSLGLPATFLLGGNVRRAPTQQIALHDGDVVVFGGPARLLYHGVKPLPAGEHPRLGASRINLTFRKAQ